MDDFYQPSVGDSVLLDTRPRKKGNIRYIGCVIGKKGTYYGIELNKATGKNNGEIGKKKYFKCEPNCGLFVKRTKILKPLRYSSIRNMGASKQKNVSIPNKKKAEIGKIISYYRYKYHLTSLLLSEHTISLIYIFWNPVPFEFISRRYNNTQIKITKKWILSNTNEFGIQLLGYGAIFPFKEWKMLEMNDQCIQYSLQFNKTDTPRQYGHIGIVITKPTFKLFNGLTKIESKNSGCIFIMDKEFEDKYNDACVIPTIFGANIEEKMPHFLNFEIGVNINISIIIQCYVKNNKWKSRVIINKKSVKKSYALQNVINIKMKQFRVGFVLYNDRDDSKNSIYIHNQVLGINDKVKDWE